eukprot:m.229450 g.229450  ORF g.229450 m.229450 type:complete len:111 (+) comp15681_c0_seq6:386-718(+)
MFDFEFEFCNAYRGYRSHSPKEHVKDVMVPCVSYVVTSQVPFGTGDCQQTCIGSLSHSQRDGRAARPASDVTPSLPMSPPIKKNSANDFSSQMMDIKCFGEEYLAVMCAR